MQAYTSPGRTLGFSGGNRLIIWCLGVVVAAVIILTGFLYNRHEIRISVDNKEIVLIMRGGTVSEALKKGNVLLRERDIVQPSLKTTLTKDQKVKITRMVCVNLLVDGKSNKYWTPIVTVNQVLKRLNVAINPGDQVIPAPNKIVSSEETIEIIRFTENYIKQPVKVPFKVERRNDKSIERGVNRVVQQGREGLIQRTVKITLKNGKEIKRELVGTTVVRKPVNKIVSVGTLRVIVSRGEDIKFSRVIRMSATAYSYTGHRTASGIYPYRGSVAVDPRVIPLGTKLYIEGYGYAKALDVGSAIKGNRVDVFFDSDRLAHRWGRRSVKVYILE